MPVQIPQVILSDFIPKRRLVTNVTNSEFAEVTTSENHGYLTGYVVRVFVPKVYGMALFQQTQIVVTGLTTFTTTMDTLNQAAFVTPTFTGDNPFTQAQVIPISGVENNIAGTPDS